MTIGAELDELQRRGVLLFLEGKKLRYRGPKGSITDADREWLRSHRDDVVEALRSRSLARSERVPLSAGQQSLWMTERLSQIGAINNLASAVRVRTGADLEASHDALQLLLDRHDMLRATFHLDEQGELYQMVAGGMVAVVEFHDAIGKPEDELRAALEAERERPFDLERGPQIRLHVFAISPNEHVQLLVVHHIVSDGQSVIVLMIELIEILASIKTGVALELSPIRTSYSEYVQQRDAMLSGPEGERLWCYWRDELQDLPPALELDFDHERDPTAPFRGDTLDVPLDSDLTADLDQLALVTGATKFVVFLTLFQLFLARQSGTTDIIVGTSFSDRPSDSTEVVGDYINALPVRARLHWEMTIREALTQQRGVIGRAMDAQAYPGQTLIERLRPERGGAASPLFNCFFTFGHVPVIGDFGPLLGGAGGAVTYKGLELRPIPISSQRDNFDLSLTVGQSPEKTVCRFNYAANLFERPSAERLADEFVQFLRECATNPDDTLLGARQRTRLLKEFNDTARPMDRRPFIEQFMERAPAFANRIAVRFKAEAITYEQLLAKSQDMAFRLRDAGARRGSIVGILMERTPDMLAALLAVQQAGAAYLPLDPAYPSERLAFMAVDSGMELVVSDRGSPDWISADISVLAPHPEELPAGSRREPWGRAEAADLAYILYTSGSTGQPNGVAISHGALSNFLGSMLVEPGIGMSDVFCAVTTISFDIAALELFGPLLVGATIDLLPREVAGNGPAISARCKESGATMLQATPTVWRQLIDADWQPPAEFRALSGGEPLPPDLADALLTRQAVVWNLYGPTETTIHSMVAQITDAHDIHVGRPIANTQIYVLDHQGGLVPPDVEGNIWIAGDGLAIGYHDRPALNQERFKPDPFSATPGARMYRTGDIGLWRRDGTLLHLGRSDDQIKLRGFRIEPAEIETVLAARAEIQRVVVVPRSSGDDIRLVAFLVMAPNETLVSSDLRQYVRGHLPEHMVPAMFVDVPELPVTPNGKVNKRSLPNPFVGAAADRVKGGLNGPLEIALAEVWQKVLDQQDIGPGDNFFEVGGHSLLAIKVAAQFERRTGKRLAPEALFFHTLREIAIALEASEGPRSGLSRVRQAWRRRRR